MIRYITLAVALFGVAQSQSVMGEWKSYTSPLEINDMVMDGDKVFSATRGGLLEYSFTSEEFKTYTNIDGLMNTDLCEIAMDSLGNLWLGGNSPNGTIQIYRDGQSIEEFDFELSEILQIEVADSIIFVAYKKNQDLGVMEFQLRNNKWIFKDAYQNWPIAISEIIGIGVIDDLLYVATEDGLISATYKESNLKNPSSWNYAFDNVHTTIQSLYSTGKQIVFQTNNDIYRINQDNELELIIDYFNYTLRQISVTQDGIVWGTLHNKLIEFGETAKEIEILLRNYSTLSLSIRPNGLPIIGTKEGLAIPTNTNKSLNYFRPNCPLTNDFSAITVLSDGRLVAGSSKGLAILEEWGWRNITETTSFDTIVHSSFNYNSFAADTIPVDFGGFIADIKEGPDGLVYLAIRGTYPEPIRHGGGIIIIDIDNPSDYTLIDDTYLDYWFTSSNHDPYLVVKDLIFDKSGNLWVADAYARAQHNPISIFNQNFDKHQAVKATSSNGISLTPNTIEIDSWNRAWVGFFEGEENAGFTNGGFLMIVNNDETLSENDLNVYSQKINSLTDGSEQVSTIWDLAITSNDRLYAVTPIGLEYVDLQSSNTNPIRNYSNFTYFPNIAFTQFSKVELDADENIWTTTPQNGIHVLLNNVSFWPDNDPDLAVESINIETSQLLSDAVTDIAFDNDNGLAVITTNKGISVFRIPFVKSKKNYTKVRVFPSPFVLSKHSFLVIDQLTTNSSAQILTLDGRVIKKLSHQDIGIHGDQIQWDGRSENGQLVGSGVYIISVYDEKGNQAFEKISIIR
ncbi:MAG: hypothetical protein HQ509_06130 [Candidatus Marinimicrobia bacterium]|nr:hypothetical protein [Candidatus Neomarinimicrobiota bacterium]